MDCGKCYYSETIDGVEFCNYWHEDVELSDCCDEFVNVYRLKELLDAFFESLNDNDDFSSIVKDFVGL